MLNMVSFQICPGHSYDCAQSFPDGLFDGFEKM
jgi:hypothetical protein